MKKTLYIIPGWQETCRRKPYQAIVHIAESKGYEVVCKNIDWKQPLTKQIFPVNPQDVIFGFSLGTILAWLVAQNYECKHIILASMTPHSSFTDKKIRRSFSELVGVRFFSDMAKHVSISHLAKKQTIMYGQKEEVEANIIVPNTGHTLTDAYIDAIQKLL